MGQVQQKMRRALKSNESGTSAFAELEQPDKERFFDFAYIERITRKFSSNSLINRDSSWSVYDGELDDGSEVAVMVVDLTEIYDSSDSTILRETFLHQVARQSRITHTNIIRFRGYFESKVKDMRGFVYDYMPLGSLQDYLKRSKVTGARALSWGDRLQVALDAATGLSHFHHYFEPKTIHGDVHSGFIMLDFNIRARITFPPYGQSHDEETTRVRGRLFYIDPEYVNTGRLTAKSDVYSFGVVLLEIISGKTPEDIYLARRSDRDWFRTRLTEDVTQVVDPHLESNYNEVSVKALGSLALSCMEPEGSKRPEMRAVQQYLYELVEKEKFYERLDHNLESTSMSAVSETSTIRRVEIDMHSPYLTDMEDNGWSESEIEADFEGDAASSTSKSVSKSFEKEALASLMVPPQLGDSSVRDERPKSTSHSDLKESDGDIKQNDTDESSATETESSVVLNGANAEEDQNKILASTQSDGFRYGYEKQAFTLAEIRTATRNCEQVLGKGGFASVYYGKLQDEREVAVKIHHQRMSNLSRQGPDEFTNEVNLLLKIHHKNIVSLRGYCHEDGERILIYDFMSGGTLRQRLLRKDRENNLSWIDRLHIAVDVATGVEYLHEGCTPKIIHRDIKSENILLDSKKSGRQVAKVADFGISKQYSEEDVNKTHLSTLVKGSYGYMDPEYAQIGWLSEKSDVYSFGVLLFEIISGRPPNVTNHEDPRQSNLLNWVRDRLKSNDLISIVDPALTGTYSKKTMWKVVNLALSCVEPSNTSRPDMTTALEDLKEALKSALKRPKRANFVR